MARVIIKKDKGPKEVKVGDKSVWICMCGLSQNQPFCDGSHARCKVAEEKDDELYMYDEKGNRKKVKIVEE